LLLEAGGLKLDAPAHTVVSRYLSNFAASSGEVVDLSAMKRKGTGRALLRTLQIRALDAKGAPTEVAQTGCDLEIKVTVEAVTSVQSVNAAVIVYDSSGYRLIDVNTAIKGCFLELPAGGKSEVRFLLRDTLLNAGTYFVGLWLGVGGVEAIDDIEFAASFEVVHDFRESAHSEVFPGTYKCRFEMQMK